MLEENSELSAEDKLLKRHKLETKELQGKIQQLKKTVNKDKKRKKEVHEQIALLEKTLNEQHAAELEELKNKNVSSETESLVNGLDSVNINKDNQSNSENGDENCNASEDEANIAYQACKKMTKAEKRRQKKAQAWKEREAEIKEAEKHNKYSARNVEAEKIKKMLKEKGLQMHEINPDGNCLYAAVAHQLESNVSIQELRKNAAAYIRVNSDDFVSFITDPNTGDLLNSDQFGEYCNQLENTSAWGGQPELRALSQSLKKKIEVLQAEGSVITFGEEFNESKGLLLAYYRHYYGLGEHYNSVVPLKPQEEEDL